MDSSLLGWWPRSEGSVGDIDPDPGIVSSGVIPRRHGVTTFLHEESHQLPGLIFWWAATQWKALESGPEQPSSLQFLPPWRCRSLSAPPFCMVKPRPWETSPVRISSSAPAHKSLCWIQAVKCEQRKPLCGGGGVGWGIALAFSLLGKKWENMVLCCCCCSFCFMVSTDASNIRIVKLFPLVACPLPTRVMEEIAGFPSAEQSECGLYSYKFKQALHFQCAKQTGDLFMYLFIYLFLCWQAMMIISCSSKVCVLILLLIWLSFLAYDSLVIFNCCEA